jgi:hypothetical protein
LVPAFRSRVPIAAVSTSSWLPASGTASTASIARAIASTTAESTSCATGGAAHSAGRVGTLPLHSRAAPGHPRLKYDHAVWRGDLFGAHLRSIRNRDRERSLRRAPVVAMRPRRLTRPGSATLSHPAHLREARRLFERLLPQRRHASIRSAARDFLKIELIDILLIKDEGTSQNHLRAPYFDFPQPPDLQRTLSHLSAHQQSCHLNRQVSQIARIP